MAKYLQGIFKPLHPEKYKGDPTNIVYRSSWELKLMMWLDKHPDVLQYSSEEQQVPYVSPVDNRWHRYFPDFIVKMKNKNGLIETLMIEIKPYKQTQEPKPKKIKTKSYITEVMTWGVNRAKWEAAEQFCKKRGWRFIKMTEKELGMIT